MQNQCYKKKRKKKNLKNKKMESVTLVEKDRNLKRNSQVSIRPYSAFAESNMGLEKYEMVVFEGVVHEVWSIR